MIITCINQKGGVGKTTTVANLGVYLAEQNKKVLLVDTDPQSNLTSGLQSLCPALNSSDANIYRVLTKQQPASAAIVKTEKENLHLIPATIDLAGAEVELVSALSRESLLKNALAPIADQYDYILIDCPPSLGLLTVNALVAANSVIIPVQCEYYALEGLSQLVNTVNLIRDNINYELEIGGVILTMFDARTNLSKEVVAEVHKVFGDKTFNTVIPRNIKLSEAPSHGKPILDYDKGSVGAKAYQELAIEISKRFRI